MAQRSQAVDGDFDALFLEDADGCIVEAHLAEMKVVKALVSIDAEPLGIIDSDEGGSCGGLFLMAASHTRPWLEFRCAEPRARDGRHRP